ncbi:MAG: 3-phosphoshikimate 1-carboxyvinyltransferase [Bacillota bacterium]
MGWMAVSPRKLQGTLAVQPSKSAAHRALCCAALADGVSNISNIVLSDDVRATCEGIQALELADVQIAHAQMQVSGWRTPCEKARSVDCNESGSTLRFLVPMALIRGGGRVRFTGRGRLMQRPMEIYHAIFRQNGVEWSADGESITVSGRLKPGTYEMPGNVSSQFLTGLLFALPVLDGDSCIRLSSPLESGGYVEMTRAMQARFGVHSAFTDAFTLHIPGNQRYTSCDVRIEGDYSHAAFFMVAGAVGGDVTLKGLSADTTQGDRAIVDILRRMGADISEDENGIHICGKGLHGTEIDASQIPDLIPVLSVAACAAKGETRIYNAARLRFKECDRLSAVAEELGALGAAIRESADELHIRGTGALKGGVCKSHSDHRMAMSLAVASSICTEEVVIDGWECVSKSAAAFWEEFRELGGCAVERNMGK